MAGQRQPIELLLNNGKKHLTKNEIEFRKQNEVKAGQNNIKCPPYLPESLRKEFKHISKELLKIGIMTNLDCDCLARFLIAQMDYVNLVEMTAKFSEKGLEIEDLETMDSLSKLKNRAFTQCRQAASDLGLSISSRCRLVVNKKEGAKEVSKYDKFAKGASG